MQRLTTPFGFRTTAAEVVKGIDLSGERAVTTGGASAIAGAEKKTKAEARQKKT